MRAVGVAASTAPPCLSLRRGLARKVLRRYSDGDYIRAAETKVALASDDPKRRRRAELILRILEIGDEPNRAWAREALGGDQAVAEYLLLRRIFKERLNLNDLNE